MLPATKVKPGSASGCLANGMPGFNAAYVVMSVLHRMNSSGLPHAGGIAKTEAFNAREGVTNPEIHCLKE